MAYEDKFRSVRETGPRPGTEVLVKGTPEEQEEEQHELTLDLDVEYEEDGEETLEALRLRRQSPPPLVADVDVSDMTPPQPGEFRQVDARPVPPSTNPPRHITSVLSDIERMIVDEDGLFEELEDDAYSDMLISLLDEAKAYAELTRTIKEEYETLKKQYQDLIERL